MGRPPLPTGHQMPRSLSNPGSSSRTTPNRGARPSVGESKGPRGSGFLAEPSIAGTPSLSKRKHEPDACGEGDQLDQL